MRSAGFTLLEMLVVVAVFGFLLVGLGQIVGFGLTAWRQEARTASGKADLEAVDRTLRSIVENLAPGDDESEIPVDGAASAMTGRTRLRVPSSGISPIEIESAIAVSHGNLVLRWRPYHHGVALRAQPTLAETELMSGVAQLAISYWRPAGGWVSRWREADLPALIRFRLTFAGASAPRWPDIVAAPRLSRP
jgi:general secretion pathway protein J